MTDWLFARGDVRHARLQLSPPVKLTLDPHRVCSSQRGIEIRVMLGENYLVRLLQGQLTRIIVSWAKGAAGIDARGISQPPDRHPHVEGGAAKAEAAQGRDGKGNGRHGDLPASRRMSGRQQIPSRDHRSTGNPFRCQSLHDPT